MPNFVIHEKVGYDIGNMYNLHSYNYYLGLLAPDSNKIRVLLNDKDRYNSHVRDRDYKKWRLLLKSFYLDNIDNYDSDFLMGYVIHILTDIVYDEFFYNKVISRMKKDCICTSSYHDSMFMDMDNYYFKEMYGIKDILKNGSLSYDVLDIKKDEMKRWKLLQISRIKYNNSCYYIDNVTIKDIEDRVNEELIKDYL